MGFRIVVLYLGLAIILVINRQNLCIYYVRLSIFANDNITVVYIKDIVLSVAI